MLLENLKPHVAFAAALALCAFALALALITAGAEASTANCPATINRQPVAQHDSSRRTLAIDKDQPVSIALVSPAAIGGVQVTVSAGPWSTNAQPADVRVEGRAWNGIVHVNDYARFGVGLYNVHVVTGSGCDISTWINVTGSPAVSTPVGAAATVTMVLGLVGQVAGLFRGVRGRGGLVLSLLGGIPTGLGACVLAQQAGFSPITPMWFLAWTGPPVGVGGVLQAVIGSVRPGAPSAGEGARPPAPVTDAAPAPSPVPVPDSTIAPSPAPSPVPVPETAPSPPPVPVPDTAATPAADLPADGPPTIPIAAEASAQEGREGNPPRSPVVRGTAAAEASAEAEEEPPRTAFAYMQCPEAVVAGNEFELEVGLAPEATPGVAGGTLVRPAASIGPYFVTVQVVADDFTLRDGEKWRRDLPVTADAAYPRFVLHLTAPVQADPIRVRSIQAIYSVSGQSMGFAVRPIAVVRDASLLQTAPAAEVPQQPSVAVPTNEPAADLTVRIQRGDSDGGGRLLWTFDTPHAGVRLPDAHVATDIGSEPQVFARQLIDGVGAREGQPGLRAYLIGVGRTVADQMPLELWDLLEKVSLLPAVKDREVSLFLLSEEPYIPWELAVLDKPIRAESAAQPFLGAQACVGRWVLGQRRPELPPPFAVSVASMAVISGEYDLPGWNRLVEAEQEAAALTSTYKATAVDARTANVLECLAGMPRAEALHFAIHGIYDPNSVMNGLVLVDGQTLDPFQVKSCDLSESPFVFLNACQVGSANRVLGDYGGMADAFLYAGAAGVVAPLWSIKDSVAREIALRFYEESFAGTAPAEVLRRERAGFSGDDTSATFLAYVWYGHPSFRLTRATSQEGGP